MIKNVSFIFLPIPAENYPEIFMNEVIVDTVRSSHDRYMFQAFGLIGGSFVSFPGECGIQVGDFVVNCHTINGNNRLIGGGSVAGFMNLSDAKACVKWINNRDPRHEAIIWPNPQNEEDFIRII